MAGLLDLADVDHMVSAMALRAPAFRLVRGGATLPAASCTRRARIGSRTITDLIDVGRVYDHFADGATIVLQGLHRYWAPVTALCRDLEAVLTHPVQANAYITPPVAQGLRVHADAHDVFALQTVGRKQWVLYEGAEDVPPDGVGAQPSLDVALEAGDCLYLPTGVHHAARTVDAVSVHLALGVRTTTWADVLGRLVQDALGDPALQGPLPAGYAHDPTVLGQEAARRLSQVVERLVGADAGDGVARAARAFWATRPPALQGQLQQILAGDAIADDTLVRRRPTAVAALDVAGGRARLVLADRTLRLPAAAAPALRTLLDREQLRPADLAEHLDEAGRVTLVRRLVREGLLLVVDG